MSSPDLSQIYHAIDLAGSTQEMQKAVAMLCARRSPESVLKLIEVLGFNNPGAAIVAVNGLIAIGRPAVIPLLENMNGFDYGARAWANRALAGIGDPRALPNLIETAQCDFALSVRRATAKGLGYIHWEWLDAAECPTKQLQVFQAFQRILKDEEWVVRYAAIVGLANFGCQLADYHDDVVDCLQSLLVTEPELAIQARIRKALLVLPDTGI